MKKWLRRVPKRFWTMLKLNATKVTDIAIIVPSTPGGVSLAAVILMGRWSSTGYKVSRMKAPNK